MATFQRERSGDQMIEVEEAQRRILAEVGFLDAEQVPLPDAGGRVLREDVVSPHDVPEGDNSAMDGYAVHAADTSRATADAPVRLRVIDDIPAGRVGEREVTDGTAARIMTGALVPAGANAVIPVEQTDAGVEWVGLFASVKAGAHIRARGEDMRTGQVVLSSGSLITAGEIGVLAAAQKSEVMVSRRPSVAILATGDELVEVGQPRPEGKVVNSNAWALAALVASHGGIPKTGGIVPDQREATIEAIERALECDFVISTGGVSVGAYDFVKDALDSIGAETLFWRVAMKPGKPVVFSRARNRLYFGLPGNPVSSLVSFLLFVAPAMRKAAGLSQVLPPMVHVRLAAPLRSKGDRRTYFRVRVVAESGKLVAHPMRSQGSGVSTSMIGANGLAYLEIGTSRAEAGEKVPTLLVSGSLGL